MFRAGVDMVRVDVQVVNRGSLVADLAKEDFQVFDEGGQQPLLYFGRESEPVWVLLLLDVSGSMKRDLQVMASVSRQALRELAPEDRLAVMFFGRRTKLAQAFTTSRDEAANAIGVALAEHDVGGGTAVNEAVIDAAKHIGEASANDAGRRAIVILTDNNGFSFQTPDSAVLDRLFATSTVLNAIVTRDARPPGPPKPGQTNTDFTPSDVFLLARETGGEVLRSERAGDTFRQMLERIRVRYSLHYRAPTAPPGSLRKIRVELTPAARKRFPRAEVRARAGYVVPK